MADIVAAAVAVFQCLQRGCKPLAAHTSYICKFDDNLEELRTAWDDLQAIRNDVVRRVGVEEIKDRRQLDQVARWVLKVQTIETDANQLVADASAVQQRRSTCGGRFCNIPSTYRCGKKIPKMLSLVQKLLSEKIPKVVTRPSTLPVSRKEPVEETVGLKTKLDSTWSLLMEDGTRMLGLYGTGGVGKTTLLKLICNRFTEVNGDYDVVIWVEVSRDVDIGKIQDEIGKRLGLYDEIWSQKEPREKRLDISRVLREKPRFVLLLDDLWEEVGLEKIGIPVRAGKEFKILFTTRAKAVCEKMKANKVIEVECLAEDDALNLLTQICGRDTLNGEMLDLVEKIAKKCYRLPLAIQVIGKYLSSTKNVDEWRHVLDILGSFPEEVEGMKTNMFGVLKLSYDYLKEEDEQRCFLYCALFPMSYNIHQDELVEYWIGEGTIEVRRGRGLAKIRGVQIIKNLVRAGLLLEDDESNQKVYMPNMIRDMALWMVSEIREGKMFFVKTDAGLTTLPYLTDWKIVSKMSLMNNKIQDITDDPEFPDNRLITLFLQNNRLVEISRTFFLVMSTLVVLDLSSNRDIVSLPEISGLVSLQYLKLLGTRIINLPEGFSKLLKLIHLDLESTNNLRSISQISGLLKLQVLRFYGSKAALDIYLLENLERLRALELLSITVREVDVLKAFLGTSKLSRCTQGLYLEELEVSGVSGKSFAATFGELGSLSRLGMTGCHIKESETEWEENRSYLCTSPSSSNQITHCNTWFKNLSSVVLYACLGLTDLTWLIYAANLESLSVINSPKIEKIISQEKGGDVRVERFLNLQVLDLGFLGELESIYWSSLSFPSLQKVSIIKCPKLRKLPLNSTSIDRIDDLRIEVDAGWLVGVEWEGGAEERFRHAFYTASVS